MALGLIVGAAFVIHAVQMIAPELAEWYSRWPHERRFLA